MCGIAGFWKRGAALTEDARATAGRMVARIAHRGPDDSGIWLDEAAGLALSHVRLAVIDVSPAGHQPMVSPSGRYVIVFNGEIYNYGELRERLTAMSWRGNSDTEVLLACFEAWGLETTLRRAVGMFAFALWDRQERALALARDRIGEKPLYYGFHQGVLFFGSELKALTAHPAFQEEIDRGALAAYLRYCYVPAPYSIYRGICKVQPGTFITISERGEPRSTVYWSLAQTAISGLAEPLIADDQAAVDALEQTLSEAVRHQRISDVPLGAFLSGGIDSSTVVSLMQAQAHRPVKTFTIGFVDDAFNEAEHAKAVAKHLGTDHTELYVTPDEALAVIPRLPGLYDEPFSDSSQIPTFLISKLAREQVTVSLSGDGGDELFGGYNRYSWGERMWSKVSWLPVPLRQATGYAIASVPPEAWDRIHSGVRGLLPQRLRVAQLGDRLQKFAVRMHTVGDIDDVYRSLVSEWPNPSDLVGSGEAPTLLDNRDAWPRGLASEERMMYLDGMTYLPDDILVKVDRAAMGVSLETRVPYLDHRVVELAWRLPLRMKIRDGVGKWILRQVLHRHVPASLVERPKMGFGIPLAAWLRGPLRDWAEALLDKSRLVREGYLREQPIRLAWQQHLSGNREWQHRLWAVLMFQAWLERQHGTSPAAA